ncbi:hypothetical protein CLOM_g17694 [Closterium sp. NIES-68]|nr:hypothetical protein CLOM_g17694 [Closterium sp. NIES-68]
MPELEELRAPILRIADPHSSFEVMTDASDIAIKAVLLQDFGEGLQLSANESRKLHHRAKLSDTRQGDARDRARVQSVAVLPDGRRRYSMDRPPKPTLHPHTSTTQPTTDSVVGFYGIQLPLYARNG